MVRIGNVTGDNGLAWQPDHQPSLPKASQGVNNLKDSVFSQETPESPSMCGRTIDLTNMGSAAYLRGGQTYIRLNT